jgi:hypothetical protein|tara:strand:- start:2173 stop:3945 length:1773 start_codon:yes stop_codon:yes gene_type:complete
MDFTASSYQQTIPSRSTFAPSDHQLSYAAGSTLRFEIPAFLSYIDPRQSYLKFDIKVTCSSPVTFSKKIGANVLLNNFRLYDMGGNAQIENLQSMAEMYDKFAHYSENDSVRNKRALLEHLEPTSRYDGEEAKKYQNNPANTFCNAQLSQCYKSGAFDFLDDTNRDTDATPNMVECALKLPMSGILGGSRMFPNGVVGGTRLEIDTNSAGKCLQLWAGAGIAADDGLIDATQGSCTFGMATALPNAGVPITSITLNAEVVSGANQIGTAPAITGAAGVAGCRIVKNGAVGASNLVVGRRMHGWTSANPPIWSDLGLITSVAYNGAEAAGGQIAVTITLDGTGANGADFQGGAGGGTAGALQALTNTCGVRIKDALQVQTYELTNVELVLKTATPPAQYQKQVMASVMTEEGFTFDYMSANCYRNNVPANEVLTQINIPSFNERAVAIHCMPLINGVTESADKDNLLTTIDNAQFYNFYVNGKSQPTRKVSVARLNNAVPLVEQVALWEIEKAMSSSRIVCRNLVLPEKNFLFSRAIARYGGVYDLRADGNISLRVEYSTTTPPTKQKLFVSYIMGLRRLVVDKDGVRVEQ